MRFSRCILLLSLLPLFALYGQSGYEEFHCYVSSEGIQLQKTNSVLTLTTGTTNLAILLCVEQGQNREISLTNFVNQLKDRIPDFFDKTTNGNYDVNVIDVLVDSVDTGNNKAFAYELPGMLVPKPPTDTNFVTPPWMVRNVLAKADADYNFANFDSNNDGIVDFLAFFVIKFASGYANGTVGLSINSYYTTNDPYSGGGNIRIDGRGYLYSSSKAIIQRNTNADANRVIAVSVHELGHALFSLPDMDHSGGTYYAHYSLGHFCAMSQAIGFNGRPSPYNPQFRIQNQWLTTTTLTSGTKTFTDLQNTGLIYKYDLPVYSAAASNQKFYLTYHTPSVDNYWEGAWPIPRDAQDNKRGVMIWHNSPNGSYSNKYHMPIDIVSAHGKWEWDLSNATLDSVNISLTEAVNTGIPDPIKGLDSLEVRYSYIKFRWTPSIHWWTAEPVYADYRIGSASCFYNPANPKILAFYTNPNSNGVLNNSSENYSRTVGSDLKMTNLRIESGVVKADFSIGANANIVTENATLKKGNYYFDQNVTVNSGATLTIEAGSKLYFASGTKLIINGTLSAVGNSANRITFDRIGASGTWDGIQFNSGSSGNVQYCNINNATIGIQCNSSSPTIQYNNLNNITNIGIYLYNTSPSLLRNTIQGSSGSYGYNGIRCEEYSSPYIAKNTIRYFTTGINNYRYSSPNFSENAFSEGHNKIVRTSTAIYGWYYSSPLVGQNGYPWGYNYIDSASTYNVEAAWYTNIMAENNWWGTASPPSNKFNAVSNSSIDYTPYLTSPPSLSIREPNPYTSTAMPIALKIASGATSSTSSDLSSNSLFDDEDIKTALQYESKHEYQSAFDIYEKVFKKELNTAKGRYAFVRLGDCFFKLNRNGIDKYLAGISDSYKSLKKDEISVMALDLINRELLTYREYEKVADNMKKIKNEFRINSEIEKSALYGLISLYVNCLGDTKSASNYYEELKQKYPKDELLTDSEILLGNQYDASLNEKMVNDNESTKHEEFVLTTSNYPNPFNPTTTISYTLPVDGKVSIKIIDILGREVTTLYDGYNTSGKHSVIWNARDVSSGIYFYSINFNNQKLYKKILLMK